MIVLIVKVGWRLEGEARFYLGGAVILQISAEYRQYGSTVPLLRGGPVAPRCWKHGKGVWTVVILMPHLG